MLKQEFIKQYLFPAQKAGECFEINPVVILAQSAIETGRCPKEQCPAFERPARFKCAGTVAKAAADLIEEQAAALKRLTGKEEKSCGISDV